MSRKPESRLERTRRTVLYTLIFVLVGLEIALVAMTFLSNPTSEQLVTLIPVLLAPIAGLAATAIAHYFNKK